MSYMPYQKTYDSPKWIQEIIENKWTVISFLVPAIISPVVGILIGEGIKYIRKKKKKR